MADVTIKYKDSNVAEMNSSDIKTLKTSGKYCESDIVVEYVAKETGLANAKRWDITVTNGDPGSAVGIYVIKNDSWLAQNYANSNLCVMVLPKFTVTSPADSATQGLWLCTNSAIIADSSNVLYTSLSAYVHANGGIAARVRSQALTAANNIGDLLVTEGGSLMIMCSASYPVAVGDYVVVAFIV